MLTVTCPTSLIRFLGDLAGAVNRGDSPPFFIAELRKNLLFSARFFVPYLQPKLDETLDPYLALLGSASYYLCDLPDDASILVKRISWGCLDLGGGCLEELLFWLLQTDLVHYSGGFKKPFGGFIEGIVKELPCFLKDGTGEDTILDLVTKLRSSVYEFGTPRQLLLGDVATAVLRKKIYQSHSKQTLDLL